MISQRLAKAFTKFAWINEHYDPICSIPLTKALCAVVEAAESLNSKVEFYSTPECAKDFEITNSALRELERALKEVGI